MGSPTIITILIFNKSRNSYLTHFKFSDVCEQPIEEGPCDGNFTRWGFNKEGKTCEEFNYGGCKANGNNFLTY